MPGNQATLFPPDTGIKVDGARKMVVQMHYNNANSDGLPDDTTIALDLADSVAIPAQMVGISAPINLAPHDTDAAVAVGTLNLPNALPSARMWGSAVHVRQRGTSRDALDREREPLHSSISSTGASTGSTSTGCRSRCR